MKRPITVSLSAWISIIIAGCAISLSIGFMLYRPEVMAQFVAFERAQGINIAANLAANLSVLAAMLVFAIMMLKQKRAGWFGYLAALAVVIVRGGLAPGILAAVLAAFVCTKPALAYFRITRVPK